MKKAGVIAASVAAASSVVLSSKSDRYAAHTPDSDEVFLFDFLRKLGCLGFLISEFRFNLFFF